MDGKLLARLGAIAFLAVAITVTVIELSRNEPAPALPPVTRLPTEPDPLIEAQRHCQLLGQAAVSDTECLRVWAETRDRFLGRTPTPAAATTSEGR